jgi:hypothetical protein
MAVRPHPEGFFRVPRAVAGVCLTLLVSATTAVGQTPQPQPTPAKPTDQQQQPMSTVPADQQQRPTPATPADQQQQPAPEAPTVVQQATPGTVPVPKAVPSMMPHEPGQAVDQVVAIVNGQVVLDSDVDEEHRFETIQPYPGTAGTGASRERELERLVNRVLILQQAKLQPQDDITEADVDKEVSGLRKTLPACKQFDCATDAGWAKFLDSHGFTAVEFRTRWKQRMQVLAFIQERFGAGTTVSAGQVRDFYNKTMLPQYAQAHAKPAPLASVEPRIREVLQQQQVSNLLRDWLQSLRAQGSITILHPGEEAP